MRDTTQKNSSLKAFLACLILMEISILVSSLYINFAGRQYPLNIRTLFNITREDSLSNMFSSLQMLFVAIAALRIYFLKRKQRLVNYGWFAVAGFFSYMTVDDAIALHERVGFFFKESIAHLEYSSYNWHVVFGPFFFIAGIFLLTFLWRQMPKQRMLIILALSLYVVAVGMDVLEGQNASIYGFLGQEVGLHKVRVLHISKGIEETIEMLGTSLFLYSFLLYWRQNRTEP